MEAMGFPGCQFPPGFRFHPTDQELIIHYLRKKVTSSLTPATSIVADVDLYKFNPWDLPDKALFGEGEWFFFSPRDRKYPNGARPNRAAGSGYWKATGTDKPILATGGSQCLGVKKALVFYKGRPPKGVKTDWVMHEYRLLDSNPSWPQKHKGSMRLDDWVLCRVRLKGSSPQQSDDKLESSVLSQPSINQNTTEAQLASRGEKSSGLADWNDYQLLAYLLGSQLEGGESGSDSSERSPEVNKVDSGGRVADEMQPPQLVSSVLDSIKRTLSFGALDEFMLLPPSKRMHWSASFGDQSSPAESESVSVDQRFPEFII